ncbi:MAG: hypothetical protein RI922_2742 [Bacteroidota bacterium]
MKFKILSFLALLFICQLSKAQSDTLNRFDANNKKIGWWIVYLDCFLAISDDGNRINYYMFSYFDGKFNYFNIGKIGTKRNPVIRPASHKISSQTQPLDGEYKANFSNGQTRFVVNAQKGILKEYKEFRKDGTLKTRFDYTESCGDTPFHYCIYLYKKDGSLKTKTTIQTPKK